MASSGPVCWPITGVREGLRSSRYRLARRWSSRLLTISSLTWDLLYCGQQRPPLGADPRSRQLLLLSSLHPEASDWGGGCICGGSACVLVVQK